MSSVVVTQIYNMSLARLTQGKVESIDQINSRGAEFCTLFYDVARQYLLRRHNWNFSKNVVALAQTTTTPFNWSYEYQLPSDSVRVRCLAPLGGTNLVRTFSNGEMVYAPDPSSPQPVPFEIMGDKILTNLEQAYVYYSVDVEDTTIFDPLFTDLLAWRLAFEVSMPLTGKHVLRDKMKAEFNEAYLAATGINANEQSSLSTSFQSDILSSRS